MSNFYIQFSNVLILDHTPNYWKKKRLHHIYMKSSLLDIYIATLVFFFFLAFSFIALIISLPWNIMSQLLFFLKIIYLSERARESICGKGGVEGEGEGILKF